MAAGRDRIRLLKGALLVVGILILGGVIWMFSLHRQQAVPDQSDIPAEKRNATISLGGIHHTAIRELVKDLELNAESADYRLEENRAYLSMLQATFIDNKGDSVFLSAKSGTWETDSNDLEVSGDVVLKSSQFEMRTDRLLYDKTEQIFVTDSRVVFHGFSMTQAADGMTYSLNTGKWILEGNTEGEIRNGAGF